VCRAWGTPDARFAAQAEPVADGRTLREYCDWMKGLLTFMPDGRYAVKSFATDDERHSVCAYGVFSATHTGEGGPCPPKRGHDHRLCLRHGVRRHQIKHDEDSMPDGP
jgi:hypothetical protein